MDLLNTANRSQRNLRIVLFAVILGTLPLYCLGFLLWGTAPRQNAQRTPTATLDQQFIPTSTFPPGFASNTPLVLPTITQPLFATPGQFLPSPIVPTLFFPTATTFFPQQPTLAPTLTPITPTATFLPPTATNTTIPMPTSTPITPTATQIPPTATSLPTETPTETQTATPTDTVIPPGG